MMLLGSVSPVVASSTGDDLLAVRLEAGQGLDARPGGQDDVGSVQRPFAVGLAVFVERLDAHLLAALERAAAADVLDLVLLDQAIQALGQALDDLIAALGRDRVVEAHAVRRDAVLRGAVLDALVELGRLEHRLGRDAADVQARPAELGPVIDQRDFEAKLTRAKGGRIAARAAAQDDQVERI